MENSIFRELEANNIKYENHIHKVVFTVAEAEEVDRSIGAIATKNLFLKDKKKNYFLLTLEAHKEVNLKDFAKKVGAKGGSLSFASPENLKQMMNLVPGSVTPFGLLHAKENKFEIKFYLDLEVYNSDRLGIHPLRNDMTTVLTPKDLEKLLISKQIECNFIHL